ncbi:DUF6954 family protein [Lutispora thermophila]|uniref:Uncharacterized protein n=1 Tax=Lutispora thermophila DSM 19022 TaxID=1122184 RepID=A0A1M6H3S1_9FIRM|nr:hypothetical protein SAMN02745176_02640 [Lutispora thermophila DSM 19022]
MENKSPIYYIIYTIFIVSFILIAFFGIGPLLFADGTMGERILTAIIVLIIYFVWGFMLMKWKRHNK